MITIEKEKREGLKPTLKMKALNPSEYAIISKTGEFDEPMTGESQYGKWFLYDITVHEYKTLDPATEAMKVFTPDQNASYFTGEHANVKKALDSAKDKQKIKITMVEGDNGKMVYKTELLGESKPESLSLSDKIKQLKTAGVDKATTFTLVKPLYETTEATVNALYDTL